jgi:Sulfotransferase domain
VALKVVGAGLGRTATNSLKLALEVLLGGRCYHMFEVASHAGDAPLWHAAVRGETPDWDALLGGYVATVDWPACAFWRELLDANRGALVLLSTRDSAEQWWESAARTIIPTVSQPLPPDDPDTAARRTMIRDMMRLRFTPEWNEREAAMAAYERHNAEVRAEVPAGQLIDWRPGDGWAPLCSALGVAAPDEPFPHVNTTAQFRSRQDDDAERHAS